MTADRARGRALMLALVRSGVFLNPMGTKLYLSLAHDEEDLAEAAERLRQATESMQAKGSRDSSTTSNWRWGRTEA